MTPDTHHSPVDSQVQSEKAFLDSIKKDVDGGFRFVPFIGAGLSRPSGIPTTSEMLRYLTFCFLKVFGIESAHGKLSGEYWAPRDHRWPPWSQMGVSSRAHFDEMLQRAMEAIRREPSGNLFNLMREAYGALADWRSALLFLSRLVVQPGRAQDKRAQCLELSAQDSSVIDSFFDYLVAGRRPSLAHRMVQALSRPLRFGVVLTTNFDDCLETAFASADSPLATYDVPMGASLPSARLVLLRPSIIKLHGGRFGLRADYSLDAQPSESDRWSFYSYLAGRELDAQQQFPCNERVALLVCGVSGADERVKALLRATMLGQDRTAVFEQFHIYWLCFSERDLKNIQKLESEFAQSPSLPCRSTMCAAPQDGQEPVQDGGESAPAIQFFPLQHAQQGLLLQQLFQELTQSIPTTGVMFPGLWNLPFPPRIPQPAADADGPAFEEYTRLKQTITDELAKQLAPGQTIAPRLPLLLVVKEDVQGAVTLCSNLFQEFCSQGIKQQPVNCFWMDVDKLAEPAEVLLQVALMLLRQYDDDNPICGLDRRGFYDPNRHEDFIESVKRLMKSAAAKMGQPSVCFLNMMEGGGSNALYGKRVEPSEPSVTNPFNRTWTNEAAVSRLYYDLVALCQDEAIGLHFILILRRPKENPSDEHDANLKALQVAAHAIDLQQPMDDREAVVMELSRGCTAGRPHLQITEKIRNWASAPDKEAEGAIAFVHLLTLFRVPRYPASLARIMHRFLTIREAQRSSEQRKFPTLEDVAERCEKWLNHLATMGVVRFKPGGFVWTHRLFKREWDLLVAPLGPDSLLLGALVARWYGRLLLASADPLAALESIYHGLEAVRGFYDTPGKTSGLGSQGPACMSQGLAMVCHARLIFNIGKGLLAQRLSDQFADSALEHLQGLAFEVLDCLPTTEPKPADTGLEYQLREECRTLATELLLFRMSLYVLEGEYLDVLNLEKYYRNTADAHDGKISGELKGHLSEKREFKFEIMTAQMCLRDYRRSGEVLNELWETNLGVTRPKPDDAYQPGAGAAAARQWMATKRHSINSGDGDARFAVKLSRRALYWALHESQGRYLGQAIIKGVDKTKRTLARVQRLGWALWHSDFGLELLRLLPPANDDFVFRENVRFRAHAALCHAIRATSAQSLNDAEKRWTEPSCFRIAEAFVSDAQAYIDEFPLRGGGIDRAILELRRAEIQLCRTITKMSDLADGRSQLRKALSKPTWRQTRKCVTDWEQSRPKAETDCQSAVASLRDVWMCLLRAEKVLQNHRKSRWWWWILLTLKTKAAEYVFVIRLLGGLERDDRSPFLKELCQFMTFDLPNGITDTAMVDPFQLARICDAYGHAVLALLVRGSSARTRTECGTSLKNWSKALGEAITSKEKAPFTLDEDVRRYAEACQQTAAKVGELLKQGGR